MMKISFQRNLLFNERMVTNVTEKGLHEVVILYKIKGVMEHEIIIGKRASSNFFRKMGTQLDLEKGLYKAYESVLGMTSGSWKKTPKFDYILLFKTLYIKCEGCSPDDFEDGQGAVYQLSLVYNKNRKLIVHESKQKEEIFALAEKLKSFYHLKIKDSATDRRNPKWMN